MISKGKAIFFKDKDERIFEYMMFICLSVFVVSLPTSRAFVSISQVLLGVNWLLEGSYGEKLKRFRNNKAACYLSLIFFIYLAGLFWTEDVIYGIDNGLINKLPFLSLIFVVTSSRPIKFDRIIALPLLFVGALLVSTFLGAAGVFSGQFVDPRQGSLFIPHVSLSMMILTTAFFLPWHMRWVSAGYKWFLASLAISAWLIFFMFIIGTLTGVISLMAVAAFLLVRNLVKKPGLYKMGVAVLTLIAIGVFSASMLRQVTEPINRTIDPDPSSLNELTAKGNRYEHNKEFNLRENGHLVLSFIAKDELRNAWNKRSDMSFDSLDLAGNDLKFTLYRFLSSKGLRKDKAGLMELSESEIQAVERGTPNYLHMEWPHVYVRIHQTFWEFYSYQKTGNPRNHSFTQRLEIWKAGVAAAKMRPLLGWGTGGSRKAIEAGLIDTGSKLESFELSHIHNQFLETTLAVGVTGLILIFWLFYLFIKKSGASKYLPFNVLLVLVAVFMISDSPLDSQMTLNLFLFFALFFGVLIKEKTLRVQPPG